MKLTCTQENLAHGLNIAGHLAGKNINLPILNNILLQANKEGLVLISTNLEIGIKTRVRGKIEEPGAFTVDAKLLADFVNTLKKENISIILQENTLILKGDNHNTKIKGEQATDFPLIPEVEPDFQLSLLVEDLKQALQQTVLSASVDESRPELNAVLFVLSGKKLTMAATDSYRLSERLVPLKTEVKEDRRIIIPLRTLQQLSRILNETESESLEILVNENQIKFDFKDTQLNSRIIEGQYPDYLQIIPTDFKTEIKFSVAELIQNIKTTSLFCQPGINDIKLSYLPDTNEIQLRAQNSTAGDNLSQLKGQTTGKAGEIVLNYKYLMDGLNSLKSDKGILKLNDSNSPGLLKSLDSKDFLYLIMPIKQ